MNIYEGNEVSHISTDILLGNCEIDPSRVSGLEDTIAELREILGKLQDDIKGRAYSAR